MSNRDELSDVLDALRARGLQNGDMVWNESHTEWEMEWRNGFGDLMVILIARADGSFETHDVPTYY